MTSIRQIDGTQFLAGNSRDAVMFGQRSIEHRFVGVDQVEHAAILLDQSRKVRNRLGNHFVLGFVLEVGEEFRVDGDVIDRVESEPL